MNPASKLYRFVHPLRWMWAEIARRERFEQQAFIDAITRPPADEEAPK